MRLSGRSGMGSGLRGVPWEFEPESGAPARAVVETDAPVHHLDQALADGKAEAGAAFLAGGGRVGLGKAAEDARAESLRDASSPVVHGDAHLRPGVLGADLHHASLGREL